MGSQLLYIVALLLAGYVMGAAFDIYNTVTGASKWLKWLRPTLDLTFWILSALMVYYVVFVTDAGRVRFYTFALVLAGFALYRMTLHGTVVKSAFIIVRMVQSIVRSTYRLIYAVTVRPFKAFMHLFWALLRALYRLLCTVESFVFKIVEFWLRVFLVHFVLQWPFMQRLFARFRVVWEEMWTVASNWLKDKWGRV